MHGVKKRRVILVKSVNPIKRKKIEKRAKEVQQEINQAELDGYEMVYIDETLFKTKTLN